MAPRDPDAVRSPSTHPAVQAIAHTQVPPALRRRVRDACRRREIRATKIGRTWWFLVEDYWAWFWRQTPRQEPAAGNGAPPLDELFGAERR